MPPHYFGHLGFLRAHPVGGDGRPTQRERCPKSNRTSGQRPEACSIWTPPQREPYLCRRTALASLSDASGHIDKMPVLIQSCRTRSVLSVTFLAPIRSACRMYLHFGFWHTKSNPLRGRFSSSLYPHIGQAFEV